MVDPAQAERFLAHRRIAVVGASDDQGSFGGTILCELARRGYEVVPVNRGATAVAGTPAQGLTFGEGPP